MEQRRQESNLDRSLADLLKPNWEKAIYAAIFILALASRFWDLGARAMSFDECTHALYSYYLYDGSGFAHNPLMHGPFLFHANALIYFLFGGTDYTARIVPALFGVVLVLSPLLLRHWLGRLGAVLTSVMLLISPSILFYSRYIRNEIYIAVWMLLLTAALFHFLRTRNSSWFYLGAAVLMLSLATKENAYFFGFFGLVFILETVLWERVRRQRRPWLYVAGLLLGVILLSLAFLLRPLPAQDGEASSDALSLAISLATVIGGTVFAALISATLIRSRNPLPSRVEEAFHSLSWRNWLVAALLIFLIYALLFTTFFTNPIGLGTGIVGSLSYWLAQQDVQRGNQPWYYYSLLLFMYEFVPFLLSLAGMGYYLARGTLQHSTSSAGSNPGEPQERPSSSPLGNLFVSFLIFWTLASLFIYGWAGEKMPWMVVHQVLPMILLAGKFSGDLLKRVRWRLVYQQGGGLLVMLLPITSISFYGLLKSRDAGNWPILMPIALLLLLLTALVIRRLGARRTFVVSAVAIFLVLSLFTARFAWMASFINYDYATELLVYAHGGADVKPTMDQIATISQRTVGDKMIEVAYDQEAAWPIEWYLREYPNRKFYGNTPTRESLNVPIILASNNIDDKVRPFLGDRYHRFERRQIWWPNQQYMDLTWERIRNILSSPEKRRTLWQILYRRRYPRTPDDWYNVDYVYLYVRKDVAQQLWDWGTTSTETTAPQLDPYADVYGPLDTERVWGEAGTGPGQLNHPRGLAIGPDGNVYVADSDNHRIQVFGSEGTFVREWGSRCDMITGNGCLDPDGAGALEAGDGQFQEPWGIAVSQDGRVYVADTWNHRIQVFDTGGAFLSKWGQLGQVQSAAGGVHLFWGPRSVTVDASNRVFVSDTGNKRIIVFDRDGHPLHQWGGGGITAGSFEEPVGLALDPSGNVYVADTWNRRIQVFDSDYRFARQWPFEGWYGESLANKPYLAVDGSGRIYATDPEGYRVVVFCSDGELLAAFGYYGFDAGSLSLPTGIAVDDDGYIYIADTNGQRIVKFEPLPSRER